MADKNKQNSHPDNVAGPQSCVLAFDFPLPCPPILPNLPGIHGSIMQNKPNPGVPGPPQPLVLQRLTRIFRPAPRKKTNPNKPNPDPPANSAGRPQFQGQNTYGGEWGISSMILLCRAWIGPK